MRASIVALSAFSFALLSTAAFADDTAKPAGKTTTVEEVKIKGKRQRPAVAIDVARLIPRAPLPELRQPLADRISGAVEKDPF